MFTAAATDKEAATFRALLGVPLISCDVLDRKQDREAYFASARSCPSHLFLDPDTGVRMKRTSGKKAPAYVFIDELIRIAARRQNVLTLVFDQCLRRGAEGDGLRAKLKWLGSEGIVGFAYKSHASFLVVSPDAKLAGAAHDVLRRQAHLPETRFVRQG